MFETLAYYATVCYRSFFAYTNRRLQALGLHYGALFLVIYVGKHPGCTQAQLTSALKLDWGHSQRSITRLEEEGFLIRTKEGRSYRLELSEKGREAFAVSHQVFYEWDQAHLSGLTAEEQKQLGMLLAKAIHGEAREEPCITP